jgi:hypothetical protein
MAKSKMILKMVHMTHKEVTEGVDGERKGKRE